MLSKVRLKNVQIYSLFKCLKLSFLGQFLVGGQGWGAMAPMAPPGSATAGILRKLGTSGKFAN